MELLLFLAAIAVVAAVWAWVADKCQKANRYLTLKPRLDQLDTYARELVDKNNRFIQQTQDTEKRLEAYRDGVIAMSKQKAVGFPWLADAHAEFHELEELRMSHSLRNKRHPAYKAAEEVRASAKRRRIAEREARILKYQLAYYEALFPWLTELKSEDIEDGLTQISAGNRDRDNEDDEAKDG